MTDWIKWNGGECPIKSDKTMVELKFRNEVIVAKERPKIGWVWDHTGTYRDIIAYRITEDHEPKMTPTREQITAQIEALQKQLDAMPKPKRKYWDGGYICSEQYHYCTHYFDIETINGVPHIHGVAMKECGK